MFLYQDLYYYMSYSEECSLFSVKYELKVTLKQMKERERNTYNNPLRKVVMSFLFHRRGVKKTYSLSMINGDYQSHL